MLSAHSDWWFDDLILTDVPGMEKEEARTILEKAVLSHPDIQIFLDHIDRHNAELELKMSRREKASAFELVKNAIEKSKRAVPRYAAKRLTQDELKYFATRFKKAKSQKECEPFLSLFGYMPYPDDIGDLLKKMSVRINSSFNKWLVYALSFFSAPELRALAEKALTNEKYAHFYLNLLAKAGVLPDDIREELPFDAQTLEYAEE